MTKHNDGAPLTGGETDNVRAPADMPMVSVIIPVYNGESHIPALIESLLHQQYPRVMVEIIVIDNNSTDRTRDIVKTYPVILEEEKNIQSSYAARNRGVQVARGQVLAFIDADCRADHNWLNEGIKALQEQEADLAGGKVEFKLSSNPSAAEIYDSVTHFKFERSIRERQSTGAGNLFVRTNVYHQVGPFPSLQKSGGDILWSSRAVRKGCSLVYAPRAVVSHPARSWFEILKKRYRVGEGKIILYKDSGKSGLDILLMVLKMFIPPRLRPIHRRIMAGGFTVSFIKFMKIWIVAYLCKIASGAGAVSFIFNGSQFPDEK